MTVVFEKSNFGKNCWNLMYQYAKGGGIGLACIEQQSPIKYRVSPTIYKGEDIYVTSLYEAYVVAKGIVKNSLMDLMFALNSVEIPNEEVNL